MFPGEDPARLNDKVFQEMGYRVLADAVRKGNCKKVFDYFVDQLRESVEIVDLDAWEREYGDLSSCRITIIRLKREGWLFDFAPGKAYTRKALRALGITEEQVADLRQNAARYMPPDNVFNVKKMRETGLDDPLFSYGDLLMGSLLSGGPGSVCLRRGGKRNGSSERGRKKRKKSNVRHTAWVAGEESAGVKRQATGDRWLEVNNEARVAGVESCGL